MSFSPNYFLSNINAKEGLAQSSRFEVVLPIPPYINSFVSNSFIETLLNLPNTIIADVTDAVRNASSKPEPQSRTDNPAMSRYLALQCESAELPGKTLQTADVKIYGIDGRVVHTQAISGMESVVECSFLNNGVYYVEITNNGQTSTQKLVIAK